MKWWSASQPEWRDTTTWPFVQEEAEQRDWGNLPNGGKDGIFLAVVSLGWWIHVRDSSKDSKVDEAVADVTWMIDHLIGFLSANATADGSDSEPELDPPPQRKRTRPVKVGPPRKRTKRSRS